MTLAAAPSVSIETLRELDALMSVIASGAESRVVKAWHRSQPDPESYTAWKADHRSGGQNRAGEPRIRRHARLNPG
jgi:hypothetical protein